MVLTFHTKCLYVVINAFVDSRMHVNDTSGLYVRRIDTLIVLMGVTLVTKHIMNACQRRLRYISPSFHFKRYVFALVLHVVEKFSYKDRHGIHIAKYLEILA